MSTPKYITLKREIIKFIEEGNISYDDMIPSERELCEIYNLSRITVRKAIDDLVVDGYLYKVHGKGTFVKGDDLTQDLFSIMSCTEDIIKAGMTPRRKLLEASIVEALPKRARELEIAPNEKLFRLDRVYYADDLPVNRTTTYIPYKYVPGIEKHDFSKASLYEVLKKEYDIQVVTAKRILEAVLATSDTARLLELGEGAPVILFRAITIGLVDGKEVPIESFKTNYRTDKFKFYISQVK